MVKYNEKVRMSRNFMKTLVSIFFLFADFIIVIQVWQVAGMWGSVEGRKSVGRRVRMPGLAQPFSLTDHTMGSR